MKLNEKFIEHHYGLNYIEQIKLFRSIALFIDHDPASIIHYKNNEFIYALCFDRASNCLERTKYLEALSYGDPGVLLACPGPSLSGLIIRELASEAQKEYFFNYIEKNHATSFFAVTEPGYGSDPTKMRTKLTHHEGNYLLSGDKFLVGHGADATIGIVLARISDGPLGIQPILLTHNEMHQKDFITRTHLNMIGLRGAQLSQISFDQLKVNQTLNFIGHDHHPIKRGMMALIKTFNRMRPCVAAFALGVAQAILDFLSDAYHSMSCHYQHQYNELNLQIKLTRKILYLAAESIDHNPFETSYVSLAKLKSSYLAEKCCYFSMNMIEKHYFINHPLLNKWQRDVYGFEYMEGTSAIQRKNIGLLTRNF